MKERRLGFVYIFSIFTCGVYSIYWLLSLAYEINQYFEEEKIKFKSLMVKLLITFVIIIILIIGSYSLDYGSNFPFLLFFSCFGLAIYFTFLIISTFYKIVKHVYIIQEMENIEPKINKEFCLVMFFIYSIGVIILQKNVNKISEKLYVNEDEINMKNDDIKKQPELKERIKELKDLFKDEEMMGKANILLQKYGKTMYVNFLKSKAKELGFGEIEINDDDIK